MTKLNTLGKSSCVLFLMCCLCPSIYAQIFQEGFHVPPSTFASAAAFGDLNDDGFIDFVHAFNDASSPSPVNVWINNGDATFNNYDSLGDGLTEDVELMDIDNDGDLDIVAGNVDITSEVWINDGLANFTSGEALGTHETGAIAVSDFNEDGYPDVFIGSFDISAIDALFMNQGNGLFTLVSIPWTTGARTSDVEAKDINSDGHMDIIICRGNAPLESRQENEVWFGNGDGTFFKSPQIFPLVASWAMAVGDYNGDGTVDVIFQENQRINGYLNDGSTLFQNSEVLSNQPGDANDVDLIDVDADGDLDLLIGRFAGLDGYQSEVLLNDGFGNFTDGSEEFSMADTFAVEYFDIDQDNDIDLLTINKNNQDNVFWMNQTNPKLEIEDFMRPNLHLHPNPTQDTFWIVGDIGSSDFEYSIFNTLGEQLSYLKQASFKQLIDVSNLSTGVYFCQIYVNGNLPITLKFVKQ